jgi:hypothetical protein
VTAPLGELTEQQLLDQLQQVARQRAALDAEYIRVFARYQKVRARNGDTGERSAPYEIAVALHVSRDCAAARMHVATSMSERLPNTLAALSTGHLDLPKARALVDLTDLMSVGDARAVEAKVLPKATARTLARLRERIRYHRDRIDPEAAERRRQHARATRTVRYQRVEDGAAELTLTGPGERLYLAWLVIDTLARRIKDAGDDRTLEVIRHDVTMDLILGTGDCRVQVHAYLHVPATTLAAVTEDPGILAGYGPVTRAACQELAARDAVWRRVFTDPLTATVKDVDRRTYRPPEALAEYIQVRDHTCVGPGCGRPAQYCQLDHSIAWRDGGCTCDANLGPLCWRDHRLKHLCNWTLSQPQPGRFVWESPVGQRYECEPEPVFN